MSLPALTRRGAIATGLAGLTVAACSRSGDAPAGLLRVAIGTAPDSLDPAIGQFASAALIFKQIFTPLTDYSNVLGLAPGLAAEWSSPDNGRMWHFTIPGGLFWSDGHPLTAADVAWSVRRFLDPATAGGEIGDFFAVENALAALAGELPLSDVGVSLLDGGIVEIRLIQPIGHFPLLMQEFYPVPQHAVEAHGAAWIRPENFVGSGPFALADQGALSYDLVRNEYAIQPAAVPAARIDIVDDAATRARMFRAGEFDLAEAPPPTQITLLRDQVGDQLMSFPAPKFTYLKVNLRRSPLDQAVLRRALSLAIDRPFLSEQIMRGVADPTDTILPTGQAPRFDPDEALRLVTEAGLTGANRPQIQLRTMAGDRERMAVALADDWSRAGIETELLTTAAVDLYSAVDGGDFDVAMSHFDRGLKFDGHFLMDPFTQGGFADDSGWFDSPTSENEAFNAAIGQAREAIQPAQRNRHIDEAERILLDQQIIIPLLHEQAHWLVSDRVSGLTNGVQPQIWRALSVGG
ncbi:peptide ABC transporter substrate-binding protein [Hyphobacterium sp.]|uniref:peptide ABC transporter substrate-binding protein n=1 Tax=Hyphobacterium sp. TaxID=2004662 RepID=UPI003BAAD5A4